MPNEDLIREIAARACCEALQENSQELAGNMCSAGLGVALGIATRTQRERTKELRDGALLIVGSRTQTETLETLLAATFGDHPWLRLDYRAWSPGSGWSCHGLTSLEKLQAGQFGLHTMEQRLR